MENAINHASRTKLPSYGGRFWTFVREWISKLPVVDGGRNRILSHVAVEVSGNENRNVRTVAPAVFKDIAHLLSTQVVSASTLKVDVISRCGLLPHTDFADKRHTPAQSSLQGRKVGKKPSWLPEVRLMSEPQNSRIGKFCAGECSLPMECRLSLREFDELDAKDVIHLQCLRDFPGYVATPGS